MTKVATTAVKILMINLVLMQKTPSQNKIKFKNLMRVIASRTFKCNKIINNHILEKQNKKLQGMRITN